jgi:tetratricopeptide (TPR) repeat protein
MRILWLILLVMCAVPAQAAPSPKAEMTAGQLQELTNAVERRAAEMDRQSALDRARRDIDNDANARLQNYVGLVSGLIGVFALLTTVLLVIIAFRTPAQAIAAAVKAATEELAKEKDIIQAHLSEAQRLVASIRTQESEAKTIISRLGPGEAPKSADDRATVKAAADEAAAKPPSERTATDFRAVIVDAVSKEDWPAVRDSARAMAYLFADTAADRAFALFYEAYATGKLGHSEEAVEIYERLIRDYADLDDPQLHKHVVASLYNRGVEQNKLHREADALVSYDELIKRFEALQPYGDWVAMASVNKAAIFARRKDMDAALSVSDDLIAKHRLSEDPALIEQVAMAMANKAVTLCSIDRNDEGLRACNELLEYAANHPDISSPSVSSAKYIKGKCLLSLNRLPEAIEVFDEALELMGSPADPEDLSKVAACLYDRACAYALQGRVREAVASLRRLASAQGTLDLDTIMKDRDFDLIRERPTFKRFLAEAGLDARG